MARVPHECTPRRRSCGFAAQLARQVTPRASYSCSDEGKPAYWVYVGNLPDRAEARALADKLARTVQARRVSISTQ
jgi:septal ring-binding cell division protein DamX